jgi:hypothetical protein
MSKARAIRTVKAVYFDTSVLRTMPFRGAATAIGPILKICKENEVALWTTELCVRELVGHHVRTLEDALAKLKSAFSVTRPYQPTPAAHVAPPCMAAEDLRRHVCAQLEEAGIGILETISVDIGKLVDMAIARQPPFDASGRGFRDALILETIASHAAKHYGGAVVLLASFDKDFSAGALAAKSDDIGVRLMQVGGLDQVAPIIHEEQFKAVEAVHDGLARSAIALIDADRSRYDEQLRAKLHPSEAFLLKGARFPGPDHKTPPGDPFALSIGRLKRVEACRFGPLTPGSWISTAGTEREPGRIYVAVDLEAEFDILVSVPSFRNIFERRTFTLPTKDEAGSVREPAYGEAEDSVCTVKRTIDVTLSMLRDGDVVSDVRIEHCAA